MSSKGDAAVRRARELHENHCVIDLHNDFLLKSRYFGADFHKRGRPQILYTPWWTDLDIHRVREAGVTALGFALWAGRPRWSGPTGSGAFAFANDLLDRLDQAISEGDDMVLARTAADIRSARSERKVAAFLGIE